MTARALIAHGGPQRLPTRAAPSLVRALRDARGSPPWTPWTILCRLDRHHPSYATCIRVDGADRCDPSRRPNRPRHGVITITGTGDHLRPEWPITITGTRSARKMPRLPSDAQACLPRATAARSDRPVDRGTQTLAMLLQYRRTGRPTQTVDPRLRERAAPCRIRRGKPFRPSLTSGQGDDRLLASATMGQLHAPRLEPGPFLGTCEEHLRGLIECRPHHGVPTFRDPPVSPD